MQTHPDRIQPSSPIKIVAAGDLTDRRREALRGLHLDLARADQNLKDLLQPTTGGRVRPPATPVPPSFIITDQSAAWAGAVAAAHHASSFESPWSDPAEA